MPRDDRGATRVTGVSSELRSAARRGEILADRYEVASPVGRHVVGREYRADDRHTGERVLLHVIDRALLPTDDDVERYVSRLNPLLGVTGDHLPGINDAGHAGHRVYVVEPYPTGATLRDFLGLRQHLEEPRSRLGELQSVVARLNTALRALPEGWRHGSIDPSKVWVQLNDLQLTGAFLVSALPDDAVALALDEHPAADAFAPEVRSGEPHPTSDLYSVATLVVEALLSRAPGANQPIGTDLGQVGGALEALLAPNPRDRPTDLRPLLEALAGQTEVTSPLISVALPKTRTVPYFTVLSDDAAPPRGEEPPCEKPGASEVAVSNTRGEPTPTPVPVPVPGGTGGEEDVSSASASGIMSRIATAPGTGDVEAHFVDARTSSSSPADSSSAEEPPAPLKRAGTEEIDVRDLEPMDPIPVHRIAANLNAWTSVKPRRPGTPAPLDDPPFSEITSVGRRPVALPPIRPRIPRPVPLPRIDRRAFAPGHPSLIAPPHPQPSLTGAPSPWSYAPSFAGVDPWAGFAPWSNHADEDTSEGRRHRRQLPWWLKSWLIVVVAMVSGALIIAGGLWIQNERSKAERERHLEQRYEELRRSGHVHTPKTIAPPPVPALDSPG